MSTLRDGGHAGMQPHTSGIVSPNAGATPWLRASQPKCWCGGQCFHAGGSFATGVG
jgi:hypothetical protein